MYNPWCWRCRLERWRRQEERRERFFDLMAVVWRGDIRDIIRILSTDRTLVGYDGFTFCLPGEGDGFVRTTSLLDYAKAVGRITVVEVLAGFGAG